MDIRTNAGYIITDCVHIGENEFVLGVHSKRPDILKPDISTEIKN